MISGKCKDELEWGVGRARGHERILVCDVGLICVITVLAGNAPCHWIRVYFIAW